MADMRVVSSAEARAGGLLGDRHQSAQSARQVTLIQAEHIAAVAAMLGRANLDPALLRRNVVVSGINLLALKGRRFQVGSASLEWSGLCQPCSRMEQALGGGGYNAMRGHGGITARVLTPGTLEVGAAVCAEALAAAQCSSDHFDSE
ncbi:MAG: MOSC domain-containing protein [Rhodocyclaceae bacterium]|nr:MOSC domain-containing protein [Rhodocyclaceae bacterium]MBX3670542.1 MOSC domain-containing protein [Rhodocyclaceae bacterium]